MRWQLLSLSVLLFLALQKFFSTSSLKDDSCVATGSANSSDKAHPHSMAHSLWDILYLPPWQFASTLWGASLLFRAVFLFALYHNAQRIFEATRFPRNVSLAHWAGATIAHRGYRSEAQQKNVLLVRRPSRRNSRTLSFGESTQRDGKPIGFEEAIATPTAAGSSGGLGLPPLAPSRRMSRDEGTMNPLLASATLAAQTISASPLTGATPPALVRRLSRSSSFFTPRGASTPSSSRSYDRHNVNVPENSMLAFIYAHENGAHGIEVDVTLTKDGHIVVMHDATLERTMDAAGEVCQLTLAEVQACRYRTVTDQDYVIRYPQNRQLDALKVPTLETVIQFCKERNLKLMIESKEYTNPTLFREKLGALFEQYDMYSWAFVATFNPFHLYHIRKHFPNIATSLLYCRACLEWCHQDQSKELWMPDWMNFRPVRAILDWLLYYFSPTYIADWLGVAMVGSHNILVSPALLTSLTSRGIVCNVWTVNSELEKQWLKSLGCLVTTDRLFSYDDASPFAVATEAELAAHGGDAEAVLAASVPSMHAAAAHVTESYYIDAADALSVETFSGSSDDEDDELEVEAGDPVQLAFPPFVPSLEPLVESTHSPHLSDSESSRTGASVHTPSSDEDEANLLQPSPLSPVESIMPPAAVDSAVAPPSPPILPASATARQSSSSSSGGGGGGSEVSDGVMVEDAEDNGDGDGDAHLPAEAQAASEPVAEAAAEPAGEATSEQSHPEHAEDESSSAQSSGAVQRKRKSARAD